MMKEEKLNFHPLQNTATTTIASADLVTFIKALGHNPRVVEVMIPCREAPNLPNNGQHIFTDPGQIP